MWHTNEMNLRIVTGKTLKNVINGITKIVGRMKALPEWTQKGAVVGLQGGQTKVMGDYNFLKS
jgi:sulfoquinovosidase